MKFRLIEDQRDTFKVRAMCDVLGVSPAGYYAWRSRPESHRKAVNRALLAETRRAPRPHRGRYGPPRGHATLRADEGLDLSFEIARQVIVFEQDTVLERLMPALDLALGHRVIGRATDVLHVLPVEPFRQVRRDVAGTIVGEKPWPVDDLCLVESRGLQCQVQRGS